MKTHLTRFLVRLLLVFFSTAALVSAAGFSVRSGALYDANGNRFMMRGINYPHVWFQSQTPTSIPNIAATKANCVRIVLGDGDRWGPSTAADVAQVIQRCKDNKLIAILEVHDVTGFGEQAGAGTMTHAIDYWISLASVLKGQEAYVIINLANEPVGNNQPASTWINMHTDAITRLRAAGFTHTLMVDAANWGQDWEQIMLNNAATVFAADSLANTVFSVHMYQVYGTRTAVDDYLTRFQQTGLPLVVGEFGADHQGQAVDEASIMELCQTRALGYMGWSWSGNGSGTENLDITVNFNPAALTAWGNTLINGANGIAATSTVCSVFASTNTLTVSPTSLSFTSASGSSSVAVTSNVSWTTSDNQTWITVTPTTGANNGSVMVSVTANTGTASRTGTVTITGGGITRTVSVTQAAPATGSTLTVSPASLSLAAGSGSATATVTSNVTWTVTDNQTWITVTPASGTNNGTLTVAVTANTGAASRTGTVTVTGGGITRTIAVTQAAPATTPCANPTTITLPFARDGAGEFCWVTSGTINFINSWNMRLIEVNGVTLTNQWVSGSSLPPRINGNYYIHYIGDFAWSHFEANGSP